MAVAVPLALILLLGLAGKRPSRVTYALVAAAAGLTAVWLYMSP